MSMQVSKYGLFNYLNAEVIILDNIVEIMKRSPQNIEEKLIMIDSGL